MEPLKSPAAAKPEAEGLRVTPRAVWFIAELAQDLMGKSASTAPEDAGDDNDPEADILEDRGRDPAEEELRSFIADLDEEAQTDLVALMWLGRDEGEWPELRELAELEHNDFTADYLLGTPLLSSYLQAGLDKLGISSQERE
ncbi:DUF3775 domain-containing protein [Leisingera sp. D0M16]|uniref:DUF3775 domain-containing protein n=1 Tax=Leisingera coralii TaxID=3351347 RepID=UPI003B7EC2DA